MKKKLQLLNNPCDLDDIQESIEVTFKAGFDNTIGESAKLLEEKPELSSLELYADDIIDADTDALETDCFTPCYTRIRVLRNDRWYFVIGDKYSDEMFLEYSL